MDNNPYSTHVFKCPKCGEEGGLVSIYEPMCTGCANEVRAARGEINPSKPYKELPNWMINILFGAVFFVLFVLAMYLTNLRFAILTGG